MDEPRLEALVEVMFLAANADGEFSDDERKHFASSVESLTDGRLGGEPLAKLVARFEADTADRAARLAAVRDRLPDAGARKVALSMAIRLMTADGIVRTSERELILEMADSLGIDRDDAADLVKELST